MNMHSVWMKIRSHAWVFMGIIISLFGLFLLSHLADLFFSSPDLSYHPKAAKADLAGSPDNRWDRLHSIGWGADHHRSIPCPPPGRIFPAHPQENQPP